MPVTFVSEGESVHASRCHGQGEEPSARHRVGPWSPVIPVDLVPGNAGGDKLFDNTDMSRQYNALNQALKALLDYDADSRSTVDAIGAMAIKHRQFGLREYHLDAFERALLSALQDSGESEPEALEAWRRILTPGLQRMRGAIRGSDPVAASTKLRP
jgi:hypothetical protein